MRVNKAGIAMGAAAMLALGGCGKKVGGQVVAVVNDQEITQNELNAELNGQQIPPGADKKAVMAQLLQQIVNRKLLVARAKEQGLDKAPSYLAQVQRAQDAVLINMLSTNVAKSIAVPDAAAADAFMKQNPSLFAGRRRYQLEQIAFAPSPDPTLAAKLKGAKTMPEIEAALNERKIPIKRGTSTLDTASIPPQVATQIAALPAGEPFLVPQGGQVIANVIRSSEAVPVAADQAKPAATELLRRQAVEQAIRKQLDGARATAKITYAPGFAPPAASNADRLNAATVAAPLAASVTVAAGGVSLRGSVGGSDMSASETKRMADFPLFDWLRIAMAMTVAFGHAGLLGWQPAANLAVQVFFALSGWLVGSILIETTRDKLPLFYFNRTTRVWIPYFLALTLLYAVSLVRDPITGRWFEFLFYDVTFTHNLFTLLPSAPEALAAMPLKGAGNHFWSIAVEEQFYLVAPLLILFAPGGRRPATWVAIGLVAIAVRQEFSAIAFGVAAAAMQARRPGFHAGRPAQAAIAALLVATAFGMASPVWYPRLSPLFAVSLILLLARPGRRGAVARWAGGVSYPFYLNHWIGLATATGLARHVGGPPEAWALFGLLAALGIAAVAYRLVDHPVMRRRRQWFTPALGKRLAGLSYVLVASGVVVGIVRHGPALFGYG